MFENAVWIMGNSAVDDLHIPPYLFCREYPLSKPVSGTRLYVTALGCYHIQINVENISDRYFAPGYTPYDKRLLYNEYDVGAL